MIAKRLYCLKCNREAEDNGEYYHCPGCGQYQQVVFYELQEDKRPDQRFEWRDVEVRQRAENDQMYGDPWDKKPFKLTGEEVEAAHRELKARGYRVKGMRWTRG